MPQHPIPENRQFKSLLGMPFSRLSVACYCGRRGNFSLWLCKCICGKMTKVTGHRLTSGKTRSCGCLRREATIKNNTTHGMKHTPEYRLWQNMRQRCSNKKNGSWKDYGGRGIRVCERWQSSFADFMSDMGPRPSSKHEINRKDNDGNYEPSNCRWSTEIEQARNKRNNVLVAVKGITRCVAAWSEISGVKYATILRRIHAGWSHERAVFTKP